MPLYKSAHYSGPTEVPPRPAGAVYQDKYGQAPRLAFSVAPFTAIALSYDTVSLSWATPEGNFSKIRLLRSQDGFSETEEDGIILWEWSSGNNQPILSTFEDNPQNSSLSLTSGRYAFYRVWMKNDATNQWIVGGDVYTIVPKAHDSRASDGTTLVSTHDKFMDMLPRVFTSATQSPLDVVDTSSDLYKFLQGFSFTLDEIMTLADNVLPEESGRFLNPELINLKTLNFGLKPEAYIATKNQKRLVREAVYMFSNKGTAKSVETYIESLTGYAPTLTISPNLLLSTQDSSFYKGLGNWRGTDGVTITTEQAVIPPTVVQEPNAIDYSYTAKVVVSSANTGVNNGTVFPRSYGTPVVAGTEYVFSAWVKSTRSGGHGVTSKIYWYNYLGTPISSSVSGSATSVAQNTWAKVSYTATAPVGAVFAGVELLFDNTGTLYLDMMQLAKSTTTAYYEARALDVFLNPKKTNELLNPSFDDSLTAIPWTVSSGATGSYVSSTWEGETGSKMLEVVTASSGSTVVSAETAVVETGKYYTFSIYLKLSSETDTDTTTVDLKLSALDASSQDVVTTHQSDELDPLVVTTGWTRFSVSGFIPANANPVLLKVEVTGTNAGKTLQYEAAQVEVAYKPTDYFDGDSPFGYGAVWQGTVGASRSHIYPNKTVKVTRLTDTLKDFLPIGRAYTVRTYAGIEGKVI
jgi:hypothetical protein